MDSLAELYSLLQEEDMWAGLWQKRCKFPETATAIAYEQHGFFEQVRESLKGNHWPKLCMTLFSIHCCQFIGFTVLHITLTSMKVLNLLNMLNCGHFGGCNLWGGYILLHFTEVILIFVHPIYFFMNEDRQNVAEGWCTDQHFISLNKSN